MKSRWIAGPLASLAAAAVGLLSAPGASRADLIVNGGFETPVVTATSGVQTYYTGSTAITGWTVETNPTSGASSSIDLIRSSSISLYNTPYQGNQFIDLDGVAPGQISQAVTGLTVGTTYVLSFAYSNNPDNPLGAGGSASANVLLTGAGGDSINTDIIHIGARQGAGLPGLDYTVFSMAFVANATTETLRFTSLDPAGDAYGIYLDAVSINAAGIVPEPSSLVMFGLGAVLGTGLWARRSAQGAPRSRTAT